MKTLLLAMSCFAISMTALPLDSQALTQKDLQVLGRALGFIENGPSGDIKIGIIQNESSPISISEANNMMQLINGGIHSGRLNIHAEKIAQQEASSADYPVIYFTEGTESQQTAIFKNVTSKGVITVSTHDSCLSKQSCVMVIKSSPTVDIKVSKAAASSTGVSFGSAFRMMVTEH